MKIIYFTAIRRSPPLSRLFTVRVVALWMLKRERGGLSNGTRLGTSRGEKKKKTHKYYIRDE